MAKTLIKAFTDKAGPSIGVSNLTVDGAINTNKTISEDLSIGSGYSAQNSNIQVTNNATLTVAAGACYDIWDSINVVDGTIDVVGDLVVRDSFSEDTFLASTPNFSNGLFLSGNSIETVWQRKLMSSNVTSTGEITTLTFTGLTIGRGYRIYSQFLLNDSNGVNCNIEVINGVIGVDVPLCKGRAIDTDTSFRQDAQVILSTSFTATSNTLRFNVASIDAGTTIVSGGTTIGDPPLSFAILEESTQYINTTKFT